MSLLLSFFTSWYCPFISLPPFSHAAWIDCDSLDADFRFKSESALVQELSFSDYLSIIAVLIPLRSRHCANLARTISDHVAADPNQMIWIEVPLDVEEINEVRR